MLLVVDRLEQRYGDHVLFSGLSFSVRSGGAVVITGDNGSGKSTLLRTLAGLMTPSLGTVRIDGGGEDSPIAELCHLVGPLNAIKLELTARENLTQWRDVLGGGDAATVDEALAQFGLDRFADMRAEVLSTGWRRRLALARVLIAERPLWFLDEPTAALDVVSSRMVADMIRTHLADGGLAVIATHLDLGIDGVQTLELARLPVANAET
jgi:heme exporter protein A